MYWVKRSFAELTPDELYDLLQLRSRVFVVEQKSIYLDCDGKDKQACHLLLVDDQAGVVACCRLLPPGVSFPEASIGRVVVHPDWRGRGLAHDMMLQAIPDCLSRYGVSTIRISAQKYLKDFYARHGFQVISDEYLEDGIPHVGMRYEKQSAQSGVELSAVKCTSQYMVHYLDHSAWLIRTEKRLLLFDYGTLPARPGNGGLAEGVLDLDQLPDLPLYVFASHRHTDHYSADLQRQISSRPNSWFILGVDRQPDEAEFADCPARTLLAWPHSQLKLDDLLIRFSGSTDSGVSVLIDSPEGIFYHGGDLALWDDTVYYYDKYRQEIDLISGWIEEMGRVPDIAFFPVSTSDGYQEEALLQGLWYALDRLSPKYTLPMHAHGFEELYQRFTSLAGDAGWTSVLSPRMPGDCFKICPGQPDQSYLINPERGR